MKPRIRLSRLGPQELTVELPEQVLGTLVEQPLDGSIAEEPRNVSIEQISTSSSTRVALNVAEQMALPDVSRVQ
jgi:hypothetical protein